MGRLGPTAEASPAAPNHCGMPSRCASADILEPLLRKKGPCGACLPAQLAGQLWNYVHQEIMLRQCCVRKSEAAITVAEKVAHGIVCDCLFVICHQDASLFLSILPQRGCLHAVVEVYPGGTGQSARLRQSSGLR